MAAKTMTGGAGGDSVVAEIHGLEGAFSFAEILLQRIWARLDFDCAQAKTVDGAPIRIIDGGRWNRLGGPDFLGAKIEIGQRKLEGDIEVHLRARDWESHRHADDMNYSRVVLHVVLFPTIQTITRGWDGQKIPVLVLLPLLNRALEEYAEDEAVERLANHPLTKARDALLALPVESQRKEILAAARVRWERKCMFAALLGERVSWEEACHHTALEILGYRFNRVPMLRIAEEFPLEQWANGQDEEIVAKAYHSQEIRWHRQAIRPANFPQARLRQYAQWTRCCPDWPERLLGFQAALAATASAGESAADFRRRAQTQKVWERIATHVCGDSISGPRLNTLVCDGFWPLLAAKFPARAATFEAFWIHGYPGDLPDQLRDINQALAQTDPIHKPLSHGLAQGLLGWCWRT